MSVLVIAIDDSFDGVDPQVVLDHAVEAIKRFPDLAPLVAQLMRTYIEVLASLVDDCQRLRG